MADAKKERLTLTVLEIKEPEEITGKDGSKFKKVSLKAKGSDGKELSYACFKTSLFPHIKVGQLDADVETTEKQSGDNVYTNRTVVQVYKDGQPVGGEKKGGWQPRGDSPETRRSIERQTSLHIAVQMSEPGITVTELLDKAEQIYEWAASGKRLDKSLDNAPRQAEKQLARVKDEIPMDNTVDISVLQQLVKDAVTVGKIWTKANLKEWNLPEFTQGKVADYLVSLTGDQRRVLELNITEALNAREAESDQESLS